MKKNFTVIIAAALVLVGVIVAVIIVGLSLPERPETIQGEAETTDYRLSGKVPARVREIRVKEGDRVRRGDTLVVLEAPDIEAKLSQAEAAYAAAQAQDMKARNGTRREQVQQAYEMWQRARAAMDVAEKTFARIDRLTEQGVMAEQKRDEARAQRDAAVAAERAAHAQYDMAVNGARDEDKAAAGAQVERARGAVLEVASYVDETEVFLPAYGRKVAVRITKVKDVGTFAAWKATKALDGFDLKTFEVVARPKSQEGLEGVRGGMTAVMEK